MDVSKLLNGGKIEILKYPYNKTSELWNKFNTNKSASNAIIYKIQNEYLVTAQSYGYEWYVGFGKSEEEAIICIIEKTR